MRLTFLFLASRRHIAGVVRLRALRRSLPSNLDCAIRRYIHECYTLVIPVFPPEVP